MNPNEERSFIAYLRRRLGAELPGWTAHARMSPVEARERMIPQDTSYRESAVLLLLTGEAEHDYSVLLTLRSSALRHHRAQISFPGGRVEEGETFFEAAVRETCEEVGIHQESLDIIGELTPLYVPVSFNLIHPVVAYTREQPPIVPNEQEVEEAFFTPLSRFREKDLIKSEYREFKETRMNVPYWDIHRVPLWGATAMIMSELLALYEEYEQREA